MNTSKIANASRITVSRSDVKILINRLTSIGVVCRLDELNESVLLLRDDLLVAHQFVKPRLAVLRHDCADEPRGFAGLGICAGEIYDFVQRTSEIRFTLIWK